MKAKIQGEGDYAAARRFRRSSEKFVATHDTAAIARKAAPKTPAEAKAMTEAEARGRARAKSK